MFFDPRRRGRGRALATAFGFVLLLAGRAAAQPPSRVLFIGNSLTYWNDLPLLVEAMAAAKGLSLSSEVVARADASLEDYWGDAIRGRIRQGGFRWVVLQQGPSSLPESRANLREWTRRFAEEIRASGATPALYMVWPHRSRRAFFPQVIESYRLANADAEGVLLPAGEAWLAAWQLDSGLGLYSPNSLHPSRLGTYAAAATILSSLTGVSPIGLGNAHGPEVGRRGRPYLHRGLLGGRKGRAVRDLEGDVDLRSFAVRQKFFRKRLDRRQ